MHALLLTNNGPRLHDNYPIPEAKVGEALIRVTMAGVCSTDLQLIAGYKGGYRGVLGHEFVGTVVAAPEHEAWIGQRVVGEINVGCGHCSLCQQGLGKHCRARQCLGIIGRDGAFAEYLTLPVANLHAVPPATVSNGEGLTDEAAVFVEPTAAALQILEQLPLHASTRVYLLGSGRLGLLVAQILALRGCDLTVISRTPDKLQVLTDLALPLQTHATSQTALDPLIAKPADVVIDVTGSPDGFTLARSLVRPGGTIVLKSTFASALPQFDLSSLVVDEITLLGSRCGPFAPAIRLLASKLIHVQPLIHGCYPLDQAEEALQVAAQPGIIKVLINMAAGGSAA